jgi:hypothetical protein
LGVDDQYNGGIPRVLFLWAWVEKEAADRNHQQLDELKQQIRDSFATVPLDFLRESVEFASSRLHNAAACVAN